MVIGELSMFFEAGDIPDTLLPIAIQQLFPPAVQSTAERAKHYAEELRLAKWLVGKVLRCAVPVDQLYHDEIWEIYGLANAPARALENFRRQQAFTLATASGLRAIRPTAEPEAQINE